MRVSQTNEIALFEPISKVNYSIRNTWRGKLSILLPIYNKAHYLNQSLGSILQLPMNPSQYRVICVDDHSTDNTRSVIAMYQKISDSFEYYYNRYNLGTHVTRIRCVLYTRTEYLVWLDPDDCFVGTGLVEAFKLIKKERAEVVEFGCRLTLGMNKKKFYPCWQTPRAKYYTGENYKRLLYQGKINCHLHRKIFVTDIYKKAIYAMPAHVRDARIMRCEDGLQLIFYAEHMTGAFRYTPVLGEERHQGLPDSSRSSRYQAKTKNEWNCRLRNEFLWQVFGRSRGGRIKPGEPNISANPIPAIPEDMPTWKNS